jgi:hypothetical protein
MYADSVNEPQVRRRPCRIPDKVHRNRESIAAAAVAAAKSLSALASVSRPVQAATSLSVGRWYARRIRAVKLDGLQRVR